MGAGEHLSERGGDGLDGGHGLAVFAEAEVAVELENAEDAIAGADGNGAAGDHPALLGGLGVGAAGLRGEIGDPDRAAFLPGTSGQADAGGEAGFRGFLDQALGLTAGSAPAGAEVEAVHFGIDFPFEGDIPALRDAEGLEDAHGRNFGRGVFADNLTDDALEGDAALPLDEEAQNQNGGSGSGGEDEQLVDAGVDGEVVGKEPDDYGEEETGDDG